MIDFEESELNEFRFSYLPYSSPLLDPKSKDLSADHLDQVVTATLSHLKRDLIPKLKKMHGKVQKRNIWLECEERNHYQGADFKIENDSVQKLIKKDLESTQAGLEAGFKYPEVIDEAVKMRHVTYDKGVLTKLTDIQATKR